MGEMPDTYTLPVILSGRNYVILGTQRGHGGEVPSGQVPKIIEAMNGAVALRAEVNPAILNTRYHPMSIEQLSLACMKPGQWQPLATQNARGEVISDILPTYGFPRSLYFMHLLMRKLSTPADEKEFLSDHEKYIRQHEGEITAEFKKYDGILYRIKDFDPAETLKRIYEHRYLLFSGPNLNGIRNQMQVFVGRVIEAELWRPDVLAMRAGHPNEKIAVECGGQHTKFFQDLLEGKDIPKPHINDLRNSQKPAYRRLLDAMLAELKTEK